MDRATISQFKTTIFEVINAKTAKSYDQDATVDFFSNDKSRNNKDKRLGFDQVVSYAEEGLQYLESFLPKEIFNPNRTVIVARKGSPYVMEKLFKSEEKENDDSNVIPPSPQHKISNKNRTKKTVLGVSMDNNQNNINEDEEGSPLKLVLYADLSMCDSPSSMSPSITRKQQKDVFIPEALHCTRARQLISLYNVNYADLMSKSTSVFLKLPSFWCLCDGKDIRSTALIGSIPVLFDSEKTCLWGLKWTTLTQTETKDIDTLEKEVFREKVENNKCFARYEIVQSSIYKGYATLDFSWNKATKLLQKPEFHSEAVIKTMVSAGDERSPVNGLYKELVILKSIMSSITSGEIDWATSEDDAPPLLDQVKELIKHIQLGDADYMNKVEEGIESEDAPIDSRKLNERLDYDFTDYLWKIIITCSSYSELVTSLNYIFRALSKGEFQPAVHKKNKTTMARLVHDSYTGRLDMPHLGGTFPLKLVVEMGIEKLRCDYAHVFISHDLASLLYLEHFLQTNLELEEKIANLEKMHHTLEMMGMIHMFTRLPYTLLTGCAQKMLKYYETGRLNFDKVFEFPVATKPDLLAAIKLSLPSMWSLTVERKVGTTDLTESIVWTLTTNQPFVHLKTEKSEKHEDTEENPTFFCTFRKDNISILS